MTLLDALPELNSIDPAHEHKLLKAGDEDSLNFLVLAFMREGFAYAKGVCKSKLEDDEIFSLVYKALLQASSAYSDKKSNGCRFFGYAKPFIRGQISREWKAKNVVKHGEQEPLPDVAENEETEHSFSVPNFDGLDVKERWKIIGPILATSLSSYEIMLLFLRYRSGFSSAEIGERLGVSRQAVERTHREALKKARAALLENGTPAFEL